MFYSLLNKNAYDSIQTVDYVFEHLHKNTVKELKALYGDNYLRLLFKDIRNSEIYVIHLKETSEPVGLFGLVPQSDKAAGIFLLTTENLYSGNMITFLKGCKKKIKDWSEKYTLLMDNCYKKNKTVVKWLKLLGFKPSQYQDDDFQIYYQGDINLYE